MMMSTVTWNKRHGYREPRVLERAIAVAGAIALLVAGTAPVRGDHRIAPVAGGGASGYAGDGGPATAALLDHPAALTFAADGTLYIADTGNNRVRAVDGNGIITTVAGSGNAGSSGDGGSALLAELDQPYDVAVDANGNLYIVEGSPPRVRRVDPSTGRISTFLGPGFADYAASNDVKGDVYITLSPSSRSYGLAYVLRLSLPSDPFSFTPIPTGNLFPYDVAAADSRNVLVAFGDHDEGLARQDGRVLWMYAHDQYAVFGPLGIALTQKGRLYVTAGTFYSDGRRFVMRSRGSRLTSIAGGGLGEVVDGAPADAVALDPGAIAVDNDGVVHVVHQPSRIVALERGPRNVGRIVGSAEAFPQPLVGRAATGTLSIYAAGDNGVFRYTQPDRRGRFRFTDLAPGRYTVYARFEEEGFSCDALNCGWSGAPTDCPQSPLNDAIVEITAGAPVHRVQLYLLDSFPCI